MKIRMLQDQRGSPDGVSLVLYVCGQEYELDRTERERDLMSVFLREGWAEEVKPAPAIEAKSLGEAPENKAIGAAPEAKAERRRK